MTSIGYLYRPTLLPPAESELEALTRAGATEIRVDLGDRRHYQALQGLGDLNGVTKPLLAGQSLILAQITDLGDSKASLDVQLEYWQQRHVDVGLLWQGKIEFVQEHGIRECWYQRLPHELKSRQAKLGNTRNRLRRKPPPGPVPFGYVRQSDHLSLDPIKSPVVRKLFDHFLLYGSIRGAMRHVKQNLQVPVSVSSARRWLTSPIYRGDLQFKDGVTVRDTHPALMSREEAAQIDRWLRRNQTMARRSASAPRALAGLVTCRLCDRPLRIIQAQSRRVQGETRNTEIENSAMKTYRYLRCDRCRCSHRYDVVFQEAITMVCEHLPQRLKMFNPEAISQAKSVLNRKLSETETILDELQSETFSIETDRLRQQWQSYRLEGEKSDLRTQIEQLPPDNLPEIIKTVANESFWLGLTESEARTYLREFVKAISIDADHSLEIQFFF